MQTCGADPRGVRVEWRDGGGRTRLVGVTELRRMMGTNPNLALSVLEGLRRWEAGKSAGGMDPQRKGWGKLHDRAGDDSSSSTSSGGKTPRAKAPKPPPKAPKKRPRHFESSDEEAPPPKGSRASPRPRPSRTPRARAKPPAPPKTPSPPLARKGPGPLWERAGCRGHPVCPLGGGGQWGDRQPSDGVGGLG